MAEIVGGLSPREAAEGGITFLLKSSEQVVNEESEGIENYQDAVKEHINFSCLVGTLADKENENDNPFDSLAKEMCFLIPSGKIKKKIIREGYGEKPANMSIVKIDYNAYVQYDAQPFDSTYARDNPHLFSVNNSEVIEGLDIAVQSMKINEKSQFLIDPEYAYKDGGLNRIPANSVVLFEIEMRDIINSTEANNDQPKNTKEFKYVYKNCLARCVRGKNMFKLQDYSGAVQQYNAATESLENAMLNDYEDQKLSDELLVRLYTNLLVCHTILQNPKRGCSCANTIYDIAKSNTTEISSKVYYNNAKCLKMLGDFKLAEKRFRIALKMEPNSPEIIGELQALHKAEEAYKKRELQMGRALMASSN